MASRTREEVDLVMHVCPIIHCIALANLMAVEKKGVVLQGQTLHAHGRRKKKRVAIQCAKEPAFAPMPYQILAKRSHSKIYQ